MTPIRNIAFDPVNPYGSPYQAGLRATIHRAKSKPSSAAEVQRVRDHVRRLLPVVRKAMQKYSWPSKVSEAQVLKKMHCGKVSKMMEILLRRDGFDVCRARRGEDHAFIVVGGDIIVDGAHLKFDRNLPAADRGDILVLPYRDLEARLHVWANGNPKRVESLRRLWDFRGRGMKIESALHYRVGHDPKAIDRPIQEQVEELVERMWKERKWVRVHGDPRLA